jgi:ribokinase
MSAGRVVVVGSINVDLTVSVDHLPAPGETVVGGRLTRSGGGKGANQAVAAARAGAAAALVGMVGMDDDGDRQLADLTAGGVDVSVVQRCADAATGTAVILLADGGENSIVVSSGANHRLAAADIDDLVLLAADVVVGQTELPPDVVDAAAAIARRAGIRFVLNCAPVVAVSAATLGSADPLVVNEVEGMQLLGRSASAEDLASALRNEIGARSVVVTCGADGAVVVDRDGLDHLAAVAVDAVDTTGAGDAFVGTLAAVLAQGESLRAAVREAVRTASETVTRRGARATGAQET